MIRAIKSFLAKRKVGRAYRLEEAGRRAEARAVLESAADDLRGEWRTGCLNKIGMLSYDLGDFKVACQAYERALESAPNDATLLMNLGNARDQMKDGPGARSAYERALQAEPKRPEILFNYGVFLAQRDPPRAFRLVCESIEACNADGMGWNGDLAAHNLVQLALDQGRSDEALTFFASLEPTAKKEVALTCRLGRAHLLSKRGRHEEAIAIYRAELPDDPADPRGPLNLVFALCRAGRYDEAQVTVSNLDSPWSDFGEGHLHEARGDKTQAVDAYRRFLDGVPDAGRWPLDPVRPLIEHAEEVVGAASSNAERLHVPDNEGHRSDV
jgi:tetratricopeptide (TPR) repeat protein